MTIGRRDVEKDIVPKIGDNVMICCNAIILGGVNIGDDAVIGAGSIVLRDVGRGEVVHGVVK